MNATPAKARGFSAGLVSVNVRTAVPPAVMGLSVNVFSIRGGAIALRVAVAVLPVPPFVEDTELLVFSKSPPASVLTEIVTWHELLAAIVPAVRETESNVLETLPPHCETFGMLARVIPEGKVSVKATPDRGALFGLVMVNVKADDCPTLTGFGEKVFAIWGGVRVCSTMSVSQVGSALVAF